MNPYDPNSLYSYPGWPAWVPSTSLMTLPMGGLGTIAARNSAALGNSRLMGDNDVCRPGRIYTYRTWSKVAIDPEREVTLQIPEGGGTSGLGLFPLIPFIAIPGLAYATYRGLAGDSAWDAARQMGWRIKAPRGHASFWQNRNPEPSGLGRNGYKTSLNVTATTEGVKAGALKWAARRILSFMSGSSNPANVENIAPGWLYERDRDEEGGGLLTRVAEAVIGHDRTRAATELGSEIASTAETAILGSVAEREAEASQSSTRTTIGIIAGLAAVAFGVFIATRKGSAKLESRAYGAATGPLREARSAARGAAGAALMMNRRRRNGKPIQRAWGTGWMIVMYSTLRGDPTPPRYYRFDTHAQAERFGKAQAKKYGADVIVRRENYVNRQGEKEFI